MSLPLGLCWALRLCVIKFFVASVASRSNNHPMTAIFDLDAPVTSFSPRLPIVRVEPSPVPARDRIESDTPIVPRAIAEALLEQTSAELKTPLPRRWAIDLTRRAQTIYNHNPDFRAAVHRPGNAGRDYLWTFMRHWLSAYLQKYRPDLYCRL